MTSAARILSAQVIALAAILAVCAVVIPNGSSASPGENLEYESQSGSLDIKSDVPASWTDVDTVKITTKNGSITLSSQQITYMKSHSKDVTFEISEPGTDGLSRGDASKGYKKVSLALTDSEGNNYAPGGYIKVRIPYELGYLENPDGIAVKRINDEGSLIDMLDVHYENGGVEFTTSYFSDFLIIPSYEPYTPMVLSALGLVCIVAVVLIAYALVRMRYRLGGSL